MAKILNEKNLPTHWSLRKYIKLMLICKKLMLIFKINFNLKNKDERTTQCLDGPALTAEVVATKGGKGTVF